MCEKNLEGKVLSPSSKDKKDEEILPSDWEPVKKSKKKKRSKTKNKHCKTCQQDITENENMDALRFTNGHHQSMAKEYCKDHEFTYSGHKCKPHWCGDCSFLVNYEIEIDFNKKSK